jgi:transcriptional regulator with XRE-family HTH domain
MIGERIQTLRGEKGLTRDALAKAVGVSADAIRNYEENRWRPGTGTLWRLTSALEADVSDIIEGCEIITDTNGDIILVERNNGCRLQVIGVIRKETKCMGPTVSGGAEFSNRG